MDEDAFLDMLEDRDITSHIYSREESQRIFDRIKQQHLLQIETLARRLKVCDAEVTSSITNLESRLFAD